MATGGWSREGFRPGPRRLAWLLAVLCAAGASGIARAQEPAKPASKPTPQPTPQPTPKVDKKDHVTISARNMPLAEFIELLAVSCKLSIVCPKDISGNVSANFYGVPALDVLRTVLEANGYRYEVVKTTGRPVLKVQRIPPPPKLEGVVPTVMKTFVLQYATAADVAKVIEKVLTKNGSVTSTPGRNALVVQDVAETMASVESVVKLMDAAPRQVMIDAKIVELSQSDVEELGFNWSMFQNMSIADITAETSFARTALRTLTELTGQPDSHTESVVQTTGCKVDLRAGILEENNATLVLDFFDTLTNTTIISRPSIRTLDNKPAHILSGQNVPIPLFDYSKETGVKTLSGFQDQEVGVELTVTPHINKDGYITLDIEPKVESIDRFITVDGDEQRPVTNTRQASTTIRIKDGQTAVIGGLTSATTTVTTTGLPWLKDLPGIGWLFRGKTSSLVNTELIIFISPRIVDAEKGEPLTEGEKKILEKVRESRLLR